MQYLVKFHIAGECGPDLITQTVVASNKSKLKKEMRHYAKKNKMAFLELFPINDEGEPIYE